jgi:hypothetical protein
LLTLSAGLQVTDEIEERLAAWKQEYDAIASADAGPPPYCCPYPSPYRTHSLANAAPPPYCCPYPSPYRTHSLADAGAGGAEEGGIDALTRAAQRVPELTERKRLLDMHTNICTVNPPPRLAHKHLHGEPPSPAVATPRPLAV